MNMKKRDKTLWTAVSILVGIVLALLIINFTQGDVLFSSCDDPRFCDSGASGFFPWLFQAASEPAPSEIIDSGASADSNADGEDASASSGVPYGLNSEYNGKEAIINFKLIVGGSAEERAFGDCQFKIAREIFFSDLCIDLPGVTKRYLTMKDEFRDYCKVDSMTFIGDEEHKLVYACDFEYHCFEEDKVSLDYFGRRRLFLNGLCLEALHGKMIVGDGYYEWSDQKDFAVWTYKEPVPLFRDER